jgi:hypothetical protein
LVEKILEECGLQTQGALNPSLLLSVLHNFLSSTHKPIKQKGLKVKMTI